MITLRSPLAPAAPDAALAANRESRNRESKIFLPLLNNGNGDIKANFAICLIRAFEGRNYHFIGASDSHAGRGMNRVANDFLATDCDVWINLDADLHFTRQDIDHLLEHIEGPNGVDLVYGIYPKKQEDCAPCLCMFNTLPVADEHHRAEVRRAGRGFMLVRRALLERMKEDNGGPALRYHNHGRVEWDFFPSGVVTGDFSYLPSDLDEDGFPKREWISEDWYFCERARALGSPTYVDDRICGAHEGSKVYRMGFDQVARIDWQNIPGWFTEADAECYRRIARELPAGGRFVEVGSWLGRSMCALTVFLRSERKSAKLHAVDTWAGTPGETGYDLPEGAPSPREIFQDHLKQFACSPNIHQATSDAASRDFANHSLDAVFIDAEHTYDAVLADIAYWFPKLKPGGVIAGHDIQLESVRRAVTETFGPDGFETIGNCWFHSPATPRI